MLLIIICKCFHMLGIVGALAPRRICIAAIGDELRNSLNKSRRSLLDHDVSHSDANLESQTRKKSSRYISLCSSVPFLPLHSIRKGLKILESVCCGQDSALVSIYVHQVGCT